MKECSVFIYCPSRDNGMFNSYNIYKFNFFVKTLGIKFKGDKSSFWEELVNMPNIYENI